MTTKLSDTGYPVYESIATLKGVGLSAGDIVRTAAYYGGWAALGDAPISGSTYGIVTSTEFTNITGHSSPDGFGDHTLDNGLVAMLVDRSIKNVQQYGAKGDGVQNDTTFIQAAYDAVGIDGDGQVHFTKGIFSIAPAADKSTYMWIASLSGRKNYAVIWVPSNCLTTGEGPSSVIKLANTLDSDGTPTDGRGDYATTQMFVNKGVDGVGTYTKYIVNENIHFDGVKFDGNWVSESGEGITLDGVSNFSVHNCHFTKSFYECMYMVYSRNGIFSDNFVYLNGLQSGALQDGGGPLVDSSEGIIVRDNVITDSGYYAILMVDSWNCKIQNNTITKKTYTYGSGFQAIRGEVNKHCEISGNFVMESGYAGIWDHKGVNNTIRDNTVVKCGYAAAAGSQIHGILVDDLDSLENGRDTITGNLCVYNFGSGIGINGAIPTGDTVNHFAGHIIAENTCLYNGWDGIAVYGDHHRIVNNTCEANGTSETSGTVGNGYNGIALNGSKYCMVTGNSCQDIPRTTDIDINLDAQLT